MTVCPTSRIRLTSLLLILTLVLTAVSGCSDTTTKEVKPASFGSYGPDFARRIATAYPARNAGSEGEQKTGDLIIAEFKALGYEPVVTSFSFKASDGSTRTSRNIAVRIPGTGFDKKNADGTSQSLSRQIIIGAHYDAIATAEQIAQAKAVAAKPATTGATTVKAPTAPTWADFSGITDNAASIGALMVLAKQMKEKRTGYDVLLVAFGAGKSGQAGARHFASQLPAASVSITDAMYNMEGIYAGDKLYAHSGQNSILPSFQKDYEKRRKLYEATDVYYEYELYSNNRVALYTNQSSIEVDRNGDKVTELYREWTLHISDHSPFDELGIPIVFFEGFDYDAATVENMKESRNPAFTATNGQIKDTPYDSLTFLESLFNQDKERMVTPSPAAGTPAAGSPAATTKSATTTTAAKAGATPGASTSGTTTTPEDEGDDQEDVFADQLTRRINNTAFIILESVRKGMAGAVAR